jgi:hypothetical protein
VGSSVTSASTVGAGRPSGVMVAPGTTSTSRPGAVASGSVEAHPSGP